LAFLSNIELYYAPPAALSGNNLIIEGDEFAHLSKVMRHRVGEKLFVTDGCGKIYTTEIQTIEKTFAEVEITGTQASENHFENIFFCIPKLKNPERFEFALEKCVELGITNFIIFESERTVAKSNKIERWEKILLSAMKQSLRSFLPKIVNVTSFTELVTYEGKKIVFEQNAEKELSAFQPGAKEYYYFIFGPEGGLSDTELKSVDESHLFRLTKNRLRSETAVMVAAAQLSMKL